MAGEEAAFSQENYASGPRMHASLRSVRALLYESRVCFRVEKLPAAAISAIEKSDYLESFKLFVHQSGGGVYIVQMRAAEKSHHAVAVDATADVVIDKEQPVLLRLSVESWEPEGDCRAKGSGVLNNCRGR